MLERKQFSNVKIKFKPTMSTAGGLSRVIRVARVARVARIIRSSGHQGYWIAFEEVPTRRSLSIIHIDNIEHLIIQ